MIKEKAFKRVITLVIILSFLMALINVSHAEIELANTGDDIDADIEITNFVEPILGEAPDFNYNFDYEIFPEDMKIQDFAFLRWNETDKSYSTILDELETISTIDDFENYANWTTRISMNPDYDDSINPITEYQLNKTYIAFFKGWIIEPEDFVEPQSVPASIVGRLPGILQNTNQSNKEVQISASVNDSSSNIVCLYEENPFKSKYEPSSKSFMIAAVYRLDALQKNIKATINWINAEDENIPESLILRLKNGNSLIKEQTLNKSNAIDVDTWEFDFGEYPLEDDGGNPIEYTLEYAESKDGDLKFFASAQDGFIINNTFVPPEITSKVKMTSMVDREMNNVKYKIDYRVSIKKYSGNANMLITATLPFSVDVSKSNLDEGVYDEKTRSIVWENEIKDIDKTYDYSTTKNVDLYATAVLPYSIETVTVGQVLLEDVAGFSETVDATDVVENVGNPKTGDINIVKNISIALVGLGAILMVTQIKRKNSTRKNNVLF